MKKVQFGIVGLGLMGRMYADALLRHPFAEVAAAADKNAGILENIRSLYGCRVYEDYREMMDSGNLDAVIIAVPDHLHREPVVSAAETGLHILVEKPFATTLEDAKAMAEAVNGNGVKCMVEFFNRWSSPFASAKKSAYNGDLGEIVAFSAELNDSIAVPTEMLKWASKSSPAWFLMSHTFDLATWITGKKPVTVRALGVRNILASMGIDTYDLIEAHAEYPDGSIGRFTNCWVLPAGMPIIYELKMRIVGSKAAIDIDTSDQDIHLITHERYTHPITEMADVNGRFVGHNYMMLDSFVDNIIKNTEPVVGLHDGLINTIFLDAVHRSLKSGETVRIEW